MIVLRHYFYTSAKTKCRLIGEELASKMHLSTYLDWCWLFYCGGSVVVDSLFIINIVAPIVLCRGEVGRVFDLFCCRLCSVFLSVFFSVSFARCRRSCVGM